VDEFTAIADRWGFWSDGCGELLPFCPQGKLGGVRLRRPAFRSVTAFLHLSRTTGLDRREVTTARGWD